MPADMLAQPLLAAIGVAAIIGAALIIMLFADRRRRDVQQRFSSVSAAARSDDQPNPAALLRRVQPRDSMRGRAYPRILRERIDAAYAATGHRIGPVQTLATAIFVGGATLFLTEGVMGLRPSIAIAITIVAAVFAAYTFVRRAQARFRDQFLEIFPDALDLIVRAVRAGLPVLDAMSVVAREVPAPVGTEFQKMLEELRIGVEMHVALQHTAERIRVPDFNFFVVSIALQRRTGGGIAETLVNLSGVIRRRKELRVKARTLSAESKTSALVLGILPIVGGAGMSLINPDLMSILITDPRGRFMLGLAVGSLIMGIFVMNSMIKRALR
jgi:tight adherence protein B